VVVVPRAVAADALVELRRIHDYERDFLAAINAGDLFPSSVDRLLAERGAQTIDGAADG
jgi:hypothetical protein